MSSFLHSLISAGLAHPCDAGMRKHSASFITYPFDRKTSHRNDSLGASLRGDDGDVSNQHLLLTLLAGNTSQLTTTMRAKDPLIVKRYPQRMLCLPEFHRITQ
jgi:hypothetical protein